MTAVMRSMATPAQIRDRSLIRQLLALAVERRVPFAVPRAEVRRRIVQDRQAPHTATASTLRDWQAGVWSP